MATINPTTALSTTLITPPAVVGLEKESGIISVRLDFAALATLKGSGLAAADIINCFNIPAGYVCFAAGATKINAATGTISVCTLSLGPAGSGTQYVNAFDYFAAVAGDPFTLASTGVPFVKKSATTLDLTITSLTGTLLTGFVDVWMDIGEVSRINAPGIAAPKS